MVDGADPEGLPAALLEERAEQVAQRRDGEHRADQPRPRGGDRQPLAAGESAHQPLPAASGSIASATTTSIDSSSTIATDTAAATASAAPRSPARHIGRTADRPRRYPVTARRRTTKRRSE